MVSFVKPNLLGTSKEFRNRFENPIRNGQHSDSRPEDVRRMKQRAHVLHQLLKGCVDRRDYRILAESLPPKSEYVVSVRMTPVQDSLIKRYLGRSSGYHTATDLFSTFANLLKVWNHPRVLELDQERKEDRLEKKQLDEFINDDDKDSLDGFIVFSNDESNSDVEIISMEGGAKGGASGVSSRGSSVSRGVDDKGKIKTSDITGSNIGGIDAAGPQSPSPSWFQDLLPDNCKKLMDISSKILFLLELLKEVEKVGEKILVFSQSLLVLDMIEEMLQLPEAGRMLEGIHYFRLDGSTKADDRQYLMKKFNRKTAVSDKLRLFLISTKAGSLGVNLIGANRVVIFDACWNPTHDLQSVFRTYRFGQTKPVFVYRLLAKGTMEEKIYDRQVTKQSLSMRVIDEKQIGRHFSFAQLQELFVYTPPPPPPDTPTENSYDKPESDIIFCNILEKLHPKCIVGYHTHDSLLEHIFDEELTEEEQKLAWENYNAQKEMESKAYNFSLQLQQQNALTEGVLTSAGTGTGMLAPGSSGFGTGPIGHMGAVTLQQGAGPSRPVHHSLTQPQQVINTQIMNSFKDALRTSDALKKLRMFINQTKDTVRNPLDIPARNRYVIAFQKFEKLNKNLRAHAATLSSPALRSAIIPSELPIFDSYKKQLSTDMKLVDTLSRVAVPHPNDLNVRVVPPASAQLQHSSFPSYS